MDHSPQVAKKSESPERQKKPNLLKRGIKFLAFSLPFLFFSPILITIGFKVLSKDGTIWVLLLGCILAFFTIVLVTQAFRLILKSLFSK